jgi:triacylglycerol lipase
LAVFAIFVAAPVLDGETNGPCATRYPVLLVHGLGFRDDVKLVEYWGGVPDALRKEGCRVFLSGHDSLNSHARNASLIRMKLLSVISQTGCAKVNIIAHSKGGIECRYMVSRLGMASNVATLTTISTPHRGAVLADLILRAVGTNDRLVTAFADLFGKILGDEAPDSLRSAIELSTNYMKEFNRGVPDAPSVLYQSFGCALLEPLKPTEFALSYELIKRSQGPNDGVVSVASAVWGDYRRTLTGRRGVSHTDIIHVGRKKVRGFDVPGFYRQVVAELKRKGY